MHREPLPTGEQDSRLATGHRQRTFYQARYDAERTVDAFSARLRDEVDLAALEQELLGAIDRTLQPARASVWLRQR